MGSTARAPLEAAMREPSGAVLRDSVIKLGDQTGDSDSTIERNGNNSWTRALTHEPSGTAHGISAPHSTDLAS